MPGAMFTAGSLQDWRPVTRHGELLRIALGPEAGAAPQGCAPGATARRRGAGHALPAQHVSQPVPERSKVAAIHASGYAVLAIDTARQGHPCAKPGPAVGDNGLLAVLLDSGCALAPGAVHLFAATSTPRWA